MSASTAAVTGATSRLGARANLVVDPVDRVGHRACRKATARAVPNATMAGMVAQIIKIDAKCCLLRRRCLS